MLSPLDLENKRIMSSKRKYDRFEVDDYIDMVLENYKALYNEYEDQKKQIKTLTEGIQYYRSIESTMQKALILAEKTSKETKDAAMLKAEAIEKDANNKASHIIGTAEAEYTRIREKCLALVQQFNHYKSQLQIAANEQLRLISSATFEVETPEIEGSGAAEPDSMQQVRPQTMDAAEGYGADGFSSFEAMPSGASDVPTNTQPIPDLSALSENADSSGTGSYGTGSYNDGRTVFSMNDPAQRDISIVFPAEDPVEEPAMSPAGGMGMNRESVPVSNMSNDKASPSANRPVEEQFDFTDKSASESAGIDKTMILPDAKSLNREAIRGRKQPLTDEQTRSILSAETINLDDSIREVRNKQHETLEVPPAKTEPPAQMVIDPAASAAAEQTIRLEPATESGIPEQIVLEPEVSDKPQTGLDSILKGIKLGKKKKTGGSSQEDPFEFLGSVDDF